MELNAATQQFVAELRGDPDVLGIILFGSWARGASRPDSDVDLLVIARSGFEWRVAERSGQLFELVVTTEEGAAAFWRANPDDAAELWRHARVLFDRDGALERRSAVGAEVVAAGKPPLPADQRAHLRFDIEDQLRACAALAHSDPLTARLLLSAKVLQLTELYFDLRRLWTPPLKQRLAALREAGGGVDDLVAAAAGEGALQARLDAAGLLLRAVFEAGDQGGL